MINHLRIINREKNGNQFENEIASSILPDKLEFICFVRAIHIGTTVKYMLMLWE